jgi:hypothetical protein
MILTVERRVAEVTGREVGLLDENHFDGEMTRLETPAAFAKLILEKLQ